MPTNEPLTRLGIFVAVGYLCAGVLVSLLASLSYWLTLLDSNSFVGSAVILVTCLIGATIGIAFMRLLVSRYGIKPVFEQDLLFAMSGLLFMTIAINQTMLVIGLLLTAGGLTVFFIGNAKVQAQTARDGGTNVLTLSGWALGPLVAVCIITLFENLGSLPLRILFAHYLLIAFWVWIQRFSLHFDYHDVPNHVLKLIKPHNSPQAQPRQPIRETYRTKAQTATKPTAATTTPTTANVTGTPNTVAAQSQSSTPNTIATAAHASTTSAPQTPQPRPNTTTLGTTTTYTRTAASAATNNSARTFNPHHQTKAPSAPHANAAAPTSSTTSDTNDTKQKPAPKKKGFFGTI